MHGGENGLLTQVLPVEPRDLPGIAAVAVDVRILSEQGVRALGAGQTAYAAQRRQVEPRVVLPIGVQIADAGQPDTLQVEGLEDGVERLLGADTVAVGQQHRLGIDVLASGVEEGAQVVEDEVPLDVHGPVPDGSGVGVEVAQVHVVRHERLVLVVPHDLERDLRIVRIDVGEGHAGDVVDQRTAVRRQLDLAGVLLRRLLVGRIPLDLLIRHDLHFHAVIDAPHHAGRDEVLDQIGVRLVDRHPRLDVGADAHGCSRQHEQRQGAAKPDTR